ncbi:transposable element Tcb1 transposase [Trichonephila clavipes]|nr:transposable element Tcb1 transposase [Trichonephila clavipes]
MCAAEGNEVVFTDDARICLQHHDGWIRVWRHRGERMLNSCVMHRHTGPAPDASELTDEEEGEENEVNTGEIIVKDVLGSLEFRSGDRVSTD